MSNYSESDLKKGFLVCAITRNDTHIFTLFPSYVSFAKFHQKIREEKRCFFEIILGDHPQKPHFDIEVEATKLNLSPEDLDRLSNDLINKFLEVMIPLFEKLYRVKLNLETDLLIFTSHGPKKKSYHVIIDNYCHSNNKEAKAFYQEVITRMPEELRSFIDGSVYSKKQQFRIVGSQKKGSGRIKTLLSPWFYQGKEIKYRYREEPSNPGHRLVLTLEASLVSFISNCRLLTNLLEESETKIGSKWEWEKDDLHPETVKMALDLLSEKEDIPETSSNFPYEVRDVMGGLILLKRKYPSHCQVCHRIHEHENPYMLVLTDDNEVRHVYFDCRRAEGKRLYLGTLREESNNKNIPVIPCLQETQDILSKIEEISRIPMRTVRQIKRERGRLWMA